MAPMERPAAKQLSPTASPAIRGVDGLQKKMRVYLYIPFLGASLCFVWHTVDHPPLYVTLGGPEGQKMWNGRPQKNVDMHPCLCHPLPPPPPVVINDSSGLGSENFSGLFGFLCSTPFITFRPYTTLGGPEV